jgi:hypothetical protein
MWVQRAVCKLLASNMGSLAANVGSQPLIFAEIVGSQTTLFASPSNLVCRPLQLVTIIHTYKSFARRLHDQLQAHGIRCWLDEHQMLPSDDIYEEIDRGIWFWDKVLLCCSRASLTSWWVDSEINKAFEKERQMMQERGRKVLALIPLNLDSFLFQWMSGKAEEVKSRLAADFTGWKRSNRRFEREFERVVRALRSYDLMKGLERVHHRGSSESASARRCNLGVSKTL